MPTKMTPLTRQHAEPFNPIVVKPEPTFSITINKEHITPEGALKMYPLNKKPKHNL
jgi:hypothetical protein